MELIIYSFKQCLLQTLATETEDTKKLLFLIWEPKICKTIHYCSKINVPQVSLKGSLKLIWQGKNIRKSGVSYKFLSHTTIKTFSQL